MIKSKWILLGLALVLVVILISACTNKDNNINSGNNDTIVNNNANVNQNEVSEEKGEILPVRYVVPGTEPPDLAEVVDAVNLKMQNEGLNLELQVIFIDWDVWDQRTNLMLSTGEEFELLHVMENRLNSGVYAGRGAIQPIGDLINEYGSALKEKIPGYVWDAAKSQGDIYSIPAMWRSEEVGSGSIFGTVGVRKELMDQAGVTTPFTVDDFIDAAKKIKAIAGDDFYIQVEKDRIPAVFHRTYDSWPFYVDVSEEIIYVDQEGNVKAWIETEEFKKDSEIFRTLYTEGLLDPDILTQQNSDRNRLVNNGKFIYTLFGGYQLYSQIVNAIPDVRLDEFFLEPSQPIQQYFAFANTNAVPISTPHPEAGVQFINWLYSSQENYDLFVHGIEGKHWEELGDNRFKPILNDKDQTYMFQQWQIAHIDYVRFPENELQGAIDRRKGVVPEGMSTVKAVNLGFRFNSEPVNAEYSNVIAEMKASIYPIKLGVVDYDAYYPEALNKMKSAGLDKIVEEYKKQFEIWKSFQ